MHWKTWKAKAKNLFRSTSLIATLVLVGAMCVSASNILYVGSANPLTGADANLSAILTGMGHTVTPKAATASATADTAGKHLVLISASITSGDVNTKFLNVNKPVVVLENGLFDDMKMTGTTSGTNFGTVSSVTQIAIQDAAHQMAAGLTGTVTVYNAACYQRFKVDPLVIFERTHPAHQISPQAADFQRFTAPPWIRKRADCCESARGV